MGKKIRIEPRLYEYKLPCCSITDLKTVWMTLRSMILRVVHANPSKLRSYFKFRM